MTVDELYITTIKPLTAADRLTLARLILDDLAPGQPSDSAANRLIEDLVLEALRSGKHQLSDAYKDDLRREVLA